MDQLIGQDVLGAETAVLRLLGFRTVHDFSQWIEMECHFLHVVAGEFVFLDHMVQDIHKVVSKETETPFLEPCVVGIIGGLSETLYHLVKIEVLVPSGQHIQAFFNDRVTRGTVLGKNGIQD